MLKQIAFAASILFLFFAAPAYAVQSALHTTYTIYFDGSQSGGWLDDYIAKHDSGTNAQARCPRLKFILYPLNGGNVSGDVIAYPNGYSWVPGSGQPPIGGTKVLASCQYEVTQTIDLNIEYQQFVIPVCTSGYVTFDNMLFFAQRWSPNSNQIVEMQVTAVGPFWAKTYWKNVLNRCGYSTAYYSNTQICLTNGCFDWQ